MSAGAGAAERVQAVLAAARRLADPKDELGRAARAALPSSTGLSSQGVELGLTRHLETHASPAELARLLEHTAPARRVQVVLSANVFVAAVRALALAVGSSAEVVLRPSSREPLVAELLVRALAGGPVDVRLERERELKVAAGDEVHVYGRRESIDAIAVRCPPGVTVRGHGPGCGIALVDAGFDLASAARALSWDVVAFDQRGCLSPRVAFVHGTGAHGQRFAELLAHELSERAIDVPRGALLAEEVTEQAWYRRTVQTTGKLHDGPSYLVGFATSARTISLPPTGRCLHVLPVASSALLRALVEPIASAITCVGAASGSGLRATLTALAPGARSALLGEMQRPPLDGPVDLRPWYTPPR